MAKRKPCLLTIHLGHTFNDLDDVNNQLNKLGIKRNIRNIFNKEDLQSVIFLLNSNAIDAIETRHVRYWQENLDRFQPLLNEIEKLAQQNNIPMLNSPEIFRWIGNKGKYLSELQMRGISIVPTKFLYPNNSFDIVDYLHEKRNGIVVKPSFAAKAYGLEFIRHNKNGMYSVEIPQQTANDKPARVTQQILGKEELRKYFNAYLRKYRNTKQTREQIIIVQDNLSNKIEVSCVLIRGCKPYYIKRTEGKKSGIAHEEFGGKNIVEKNPKEELVKFAKQIKSNLPDNIKEEAILRFDILDCGDKLYLLEIEAASLRLFNTGSNISVYTQMLATVARNSYEALLKDGKRRNTVNQFLAPSESIL